MSTGKQYVIYVINICNHNRFETVRFSVLINLQLKVVHVIVYVNMSKSVKNLHDNFVYIFTHMSLIWTMIRD